MTTDGEENTYMEKETCLNSHIALFMGRLWDKTKDNISLPYRYTMSVDDEECPNLYGWYPGPSLMQRELVELLESLGVDNLQTFPTDIRHEGTGEPVPGYVVVNIIGRISCGVSPSKDRDFNKSKIDNAKTRGALMFRLDESPAVILVHENIANAVCAAGFVGLTFEAVDES